MDGVFVHLLLAIFPHNSVSEAYNKIIHPRLDKSWEMIMLRAEMQTHSDTNVLQYDYNQCLEHEPGVDLLLHFCLIGQT